ncbi:MULTISPECIES: ABC transporter ATP-binding protein [Cupriavidus]
MTIEVKDVAVRFGGVDALKGVSLAVAPGRIVTVIGPNGSGKSTLFNSITGMVALARGSVSMDGEDLARMPACRRIARGLARTFQTPRFDPEVSVAEAVLCGFYPVARPRFAPALLRTPALRRQERRFHDECARILGDFGLADCRDKALGTLPMGLVRLVEVARAVANAPRYLLLDEPAAGLTRQEQAVLGAALRRLAASGIGVLLVEHNFGMVRDLSDHTVVLDRGALLMAGRPDELLRDPGFVRAYLGTAAAAHPASPECAP